MPEQIRAHINLFGAWIAGVSVNDVISKKTGTDALRMLIEAVLERSVDSLEPVAIERFADLSPQDLYLPVVPDEQKLVDRLLRPLKSAKRQYCFGEFLATIALSGLVGESLAMLRYRMRKPELHGKPISIEQERQLFGRDFDSLDQSRRVEILRSFELISDVQKQLFSDLRGIRNKYLHLWEVDSSQIHVEARKSFLNAMRLFKEISGLSIGPDGTFIMNPDLLNYLKDQEKKEAAETLIT